MGQDAALLLVRRVLALMVSMLLAGCHQAPPPPASGQTVDPRHYASFYLWPGVSPSADLRPKLLYLLDGEVRRGGPPRFLRLRPGVPKLSPTPLWLVVRVERLDWNESVEAALIADLDRWRMAGNNVVGLQVDFDAATHGIGRYRQFLTNLRARLPAQWRLSITGLMDWSAHGDPQELRALRSVIDEVVIQTYRDRQTIPGYEAYFRKMRGFPIPFRVALVQGGAWNPPTDLARERAFLGYVVFLMRTTH